MKKLFYVLAVAMIVTACNSKDKNEPEDQTKVSFAKATYFEALGTNTVPNVEGENKDQRKARTKISLSVWTACV